MSDRTVERRKAAEVCIACGKQKDNPNILKCSKCSEEFSRKAKERYQRFKELGLCTSCGKDIACEESQLCSKCREKSNISYHKNYNKLLEDSEKYQEYLQKQRKRHKKKTDECRINGICLGCNSKPSIEGMTVCESCQQNRHETYLLYKECGICVQCRKNKAEEDSLKCLECHRKGYEQRQGKRKKEVQDPIKYKENLKRTRLYHKNRNREREESFLCKKCGNKLTENDLSKGFKNCISCRALAAKYKKRDMHIKNPRREISKEARSTLGICFRCCKPVRGGVNGLGQPYKVCEECYQKMMKCNVWV